jgi:tRNA pseudouridine13 synthase
MPLDILVMDYIEKKRDFSLGGDYRNILVKPKELSYKLVAYSSSESAKDLTKSDWDVMQERLKLAGGEEAKTDNEGESGSGELRALVIEYSLPSSAYATMALREVLVDEDIE